MNVTVCSYVPPRPEFICHKLHNLQIIKLHQGSMIVKRLCVTHSQTLHLIHSHRIIDDSAALPVPTIKLLFDVHVSKLGESPRQLAHQPCCSLKPSCAGIHLKEASKKGVSHDSQSYSMTEHWCIFLHAVLHETYSEITVSHLFTG